MDEHCRITVVGERRQVDLAVPAGAPIASFADRLARMCGQPQNDVLPSAWTLANALTGPFAPERSLRELGVVDGEVLYLADAISDEFTDPVVHDVAERVAEVAERTLHRRWDGPVRTVTALTLGLCWLIAALVALAARHQVGDGAVEAVAGAFGLVLPLLAWVATERRWPVPPYLCDVLALAAVPALALACRSFAVTHLGSWTHGADAVLTARGLDAAALGVGALIGAVLAYAAFPSVAGCAVLLAAVFGALLGGGLAAAKAHGLDAASVVAVVAFALLTATPATAGRLVALAGRRRRARNPAGEDEAEDAVADATDAAMTLLVLWSGALALLLGALLVPMAASRSPYAAAAAGCLALGVLLRAGSARLFAEVVPLLLAGSVGLGTLLLAGPGHLGWPQWISPVLLVLIPLVLVAYGFRRLMRRPDMPQADRPRWLGGAGSVLGGVGVVLALATFGLFGRFVELGHHL